MVVLRHWVSAGLVSSHNAEGYSQGSEVPSGGSGSCSMVSLLMFMWSRIRVFASNLLWISYYVVPQASKQLSRVPPLVVT